MLLYRARRPQCHMRGLSVLASCGITAVRESCVIRCRAIPAEPFERSGIDEPFATSMTQLTMDRLQTFSVYVAVEKHRVSGEHRLHKNLNLAHDVFEICGGRNIERSGVPTRAESGANARSAIAAGQYRGGAEPNHANRGFASR